jgi:hypothetical protein
MRYSILFIFCLLTLSSNSQYLTKIDRVQINANQCCDVGQMKVAWYEKSYTDTILPAKNLSNKFIILVDTNSKTTNFISDYEYYLRRQFIKLDTSAFYLMYLDKWTKLTLNEKQEFINQQMLLSKYRADSIHSANNQGQIQVWVINNTESNISIQMQDFSYICVLQALTKDGQWTSIQNWRFSGCGNSYVGKTFKPKMANSFLAIIPKNGNYETKLRFKMLGTDNIYYSNEFIGKINFFDLVNNNKSQIDNVAKIKD